MPDLKDIFTNISVPMPINIKILYLLFRNNRNKIGKS